MAITVVATAEPNNYPPRVRLDVTGTGGTTSTTITRLNPDGVVVPVRTIDGGPLVLTSGTGLLYDYEIPLGQGVTYSSVESPSNVTGSITVDSPYVWLVHPGIPSISVQLTVQKIGERNHAVQRGVFHPLGRPTAVVQSDGARKFEEFTLQVLTWTLDDLAALRQVLSDASTLYLNVPASKGWGFSWAYVDIGDVTETRVGGVAQDPMRSWTLPVTLVYRPAGGTQSQRTYADILATYATYTAVQNAYSSYFNLLAGP